MPTTVGCTTDDFEPDCASSGRPGMTISGAARLAGVLGWPIAHSRSPLLHGVWIARHSLDAAYVPLAVRPEDFADVVRAMPRMGFVGANVTSPHKQAAFALADNKDRAAAETGAVNTLIFRDGGIVGRNTDVPGFLANLRAQVPDWRPDAGLAVILGAGGSAPAVVSGLLQSGVERIALVNRTAAHAQALAERFGERIGIYDWPSLGNLLERAELLVNTTVLGMAGMPSLTIELSMLPPSAVVADLVYQPLVTPLLHQAQARGLRTVEGLGMLLYQAQPSFEAWFGICPEVDADLRARVLARDGTPFEEVAKESGRLRSDKGSRT
jgi:shikimate dehydrogenase